MNNSSRSHFKWWRLKWCQMSLPTTGTYSHSLRKLKWYSKIMCIFCCFSVVVMSSPVIHAIYWPIINYYNDHTITTVPLQKPRGWVKLFLFFFRPKKVWMVCIFPEMCSIFTKSCLIQLFLIFKSSTLITNKHLVVRSQRIVMHLVV